MRTMRARGMGENPSHHARANPAAQALFSPWGGRWTSLVELYSTYSTATLHTL